MRAIYPLSRYVIIAAAGGIFALASGAPADSAGLSEKSSWLLGNFTQNATCTGDGSDPAELKVRIAADQIESKSGVCNFLAVTPEPNRLKAKLHIYAALAEKERRMISERHQSGTEGGQGARCRARRHDIQEPGVPTTSPRARRTAPQCLCRAARSIGSQGGRDVERARHPDARGRQVV